MLSDQPVSSEVTCLWLLTYLGHSKCASIDRSQSVWWDQSVYFMIRMEWYKLSINLWGRTTFLEKQDCFAPTFPLRPLKWIMDKSKRSIDCNVRGIPLSTIAASYLPTTPIAVPSLSPFTVTALSKMTFEWRAQTRPMVLMNKVFHEIAHFAQASGNFVPLSIVDLSEISWFESVFRRRTLLWPSSISVWARDRPVNKRELELAYPTWSYPPIWPGYKTPINTNRRQSKKLWFFDIFVMPLLYLVGQRPDQAHILWLIQSYQDNVTLKIWDEQLAYWRRSKNVRRNYFCPWL